MSIRAKLVNLFLKRTIRRQFESFESPEDFRAGGSMPFKWCSEVYLVGAQTPRYARGMGYKTLPTVQDALNDAVRHVGKNPRILCTPECYSGGMAVNLASQ